MHFDIYTMTFQLLLSVPGTVVEFEYKEDPFEPQEAQALVKEKAGKHIRAIAKWKPLREVHANVEERRNDSLFRGWEEVALLGWGSAGGVPWAFNPGLFYLLGSCLG